MPKISPFRGVRYSADFDPALVSAPPYDVISPDERIRLAGSDPFNFVRISLPLASDGTSPDYEGAGDLLREWLANGVLEKDPEDAYYLFVMDYEVGGKPHSTSGLVAALAIEPFDEGDIYPHEMTRPGPKADRFELMKTTRANLEPLWFFTARTLGSLKTLTNETADAKPLADVIDSSGTRHRLWRVKEGPSLDTVCAAVNRTPLIMADGHHRYETAVAYRDLMRKESGPGPWDLTLALIVDPVQDPPTLLPIHRIAQDLDLASVETKVDLEPFDGGPADLLYAIETAGPGTIGVLTAHSRSLMMSKYNPDTQFLDEVVLEPLGVLPDFEHDTDRAVKAAASGATVFILPAAPIDLVAEMALAGKRMPSKTTLFWPKPRSGLIMRDLG